MVIEQRKEEGQSTGLALPCRDRRALTLAESSEPGPTNNILAFSWALDLSGSRDRRKNGDGFQGRTAYPPSCLIPRVEWP